MSIAKYTLLSQRTERERTKGEMKSSKNELLKSKMNIFYGNKCIFTYNVLLVY